MPTFRCAACGAKLQLKEVSKTPTCEYCGSSVFLTQETHEHIVAMQTDEKHQEARGMDVKSQGETANVSTYQESKPMSIIARIVMWILSGFFFLSAFASMPSVTSFFMVLLALFFLPISSIQNLKKRLLKKTWMQIVVPLVLFFAVIGTFSSASVDSQTAPPSVQETIEATNSIVAANLDQETETLAPTNDATIVNAQETERLTLPPTAEITASPEPTAIPTATPTAKPTATPTPTEEIISYVYNKNTKKFHYSWCSSADDIKEKNRGERTTTRTKMIELGYDPCGRCHP